MSKLVWRVCSAIFISGAFTSTALVTDVAAAHAVAAVIGGIDTDLAAVGLIRRAHAFGVNAVAMPWCVGRTALEAALAGMHVMRAFS